MKRTPMPKVTKARKAKNFARAYGSADRVEWIKKLPCSILGCGNTPSDNAHLTNGGLGRKADADHIFPLCRAHHTEYDNGPDGKAAFCAKYKLDAAYQCFLTDLAFSLANKDAK